jgi:hypothetical protein
LSSFPSGIDAFKKVVAPAQAILGKGSIEIPLLSGWSQKDINTNNTIQVALASRLPNSALAHVATSTSKAYVGPWNAFFCCMALFLSLDDLFQPTTLRSRCICNHLWIVIILSLLLKALPLLLLSFIRLMCLPTILLRGRRKFVW